MKRSVEDSPSVEPDPTNKDVKPTDEPELKQAKLELSVLPSDNIATSVNSNDSATATNNSQSTSVVRRRQIKKAVLMLMYSGSGYYGMQRNMGFSTIEGVLFDCLLAGGHISHEEYAAPGKLQFQRASKTDKGVSALAQVVSMKLDLSDVAALKGDLSNRLPAEIKLLDLFRTTKHFQCKGRVNHREYAYICPSYTFASKSRPIDNDYRIKAEQLESLRNCLSRYRGTKNYYNFTSGRPAGDASCNRYIIEFTVGEPFVYQDVEFVELRVRGQSFMLHQIRKMVGLAVAIVKGYCELSAMDAVFTFKRMDVPKAPGLGLLLNRIHYGAYNDKYAVPLGYPTIDWDRFEAERSEFRSSHIMPEIYRGEVHDRSMLDWLKTLIMHSYDFDRPEGPPAAAAIKQQQQQQQVAVAESSSAAPTSDDATEAGASVVDSS